MKGIVLAGGKATRLMPLTKITSKQLLPIYDKPMIYYPIETLLRAGIKDILIIIAPQYSGHFLNLLGSGKEMGCKFTYEIQEEPRGLAEAFIIAEQFIGGDDVTMILGDNIFFGQDFSNQIREFKGGGMIFAKEVPDPGRYGVIEFAKDGKVLSLEEKPQLPKSNFAVVGLYTFDGKSSRLARNVKPSARGELEIIDVCRQYLELDELKVNVFEGQWEDAGTFESLYRANTRARDDSLKRK